MTELIPQGVAGVRKQSRLSRLQELVADGAGLHVRDAAEMLDVSEMTIRRDVRQNPEIFEFFGGYIVGSQRFQAAGPYDLSRAGEENESAKRAACVHAIDLIAPGQTLFVDCGTTLMHLVRLLPDDLDVTLICYALNIADLAVRKPNVTLVLLGGVYHPATASFYPTEEDLTLSAYAIHHAFLSAAGFDPKLGATCTTFREATIKRAAMARAQSSVLVCDSSKLGQIKSASFAALDEFDLILTEEGPFSSIL